jgi:hypothetical protein
MKKYRVWNKGPLREKENAKQEFVPVYRFDGTDDEVKQFHADKFRSLKPEYDATWEEYDRKITQLILEAFYENKDVRDTVFRFPHLMGPVRLSELFGLEWDISCKISTQNIYL